MKLSSPHMLYLVWVVFLLSGVMIYGSRKRAKILGRFATPKAFESIAPGIQIKNRWIRALLMTIVLLFLVVSLAGPLAGFKWEVVEQKGVDIMICLDLSKSMLAQDMEPSRLGRAKREIVDLLRMMGSDRAGLVAFAGKAILQCPLTMDHGAFNIFLNALEPDFLPVGGTDIGGAIATALDGFEKTVESEKAIIIITDGDNTTGNPLDMAKRAARENVKIFCIGVGSDEGAPVPDTSGGFKKDDQGRVVISKFDGPGLEKIAAITQGVYVRSVAGDMDLERIYGEEILGKMDKKTLKSGKRKVWENRFQWFLFPALVLLIIEMMISHNRRGIFFSIILVVFLAPVPAPCFAGASASVKKGIEFYQAGEYDRAEKCFIDAQLDRPEMAELYYNIGSAAYKKEDYDAAVKNFTKASETDDPNLKSLAMYNLGNALYRSGKLKEAVKEYEEVISLAPNDNEAKENLDFVKKKLEEEKQEKEKDQKDNQQADKSGESKEQNQGKDEQKSEESKSRDRTGNNGKKPDEKGSEINKPETSDKAPDGETPKSQTRQGEEKGEGGDQQDQAQAQAQAQERLLNRLEDKPGRALMESYEKSPVTRDW